MTEPRTPGWRIAVAGVESALTERLSARFDRPFGDSPAPTAVIVSSGKYVVDETGDSLQARIVVGVGRALDALDFDDPPRVILVSDAGVLGTSTGVSGAREDAAPRRGNRFAEANFAAERLCQDWAEAAGAVLVVLRIAALTEPRDESPLQELAGLTVRPDPDARWSVARPESVEDAIAALAAWPSSRVVGKRFVVAEPEPIALTELATVRRTSWLERFRRDSGAQLATASRVYLGSFPPRG